MGTECTIIVPIWKRKGDVHDPGKYSPGHHSHTTQPSTETVRRVEGNFGEEQQGLRMGRGTSSDDNSPETDDREGTGGTW